MNNLKYAFGLLLKIIGVLLKRVFGKKQNPKWNLKTELIWATTRYTLLSSNIYGLKWLKELSNQFSPKPKLKNQIKIEELETEVGNYLKIMPKTNDKIYNDRIIIYFHGGGYVLGSPRANIEFTSRVAITSHSTILVPFYPTAPEAQYPAAQEFAVEIVETFIKEYSGHKLYLAGDSAGAALVLSTYMNLSEEDALKIEGCILISPWAEPTSQSGTIKTNSKNDVGDSKYLLNCYNAYLNEQKIQLKYPLSFDKSNLIRLPKTFISIGTAEMLLDQTKESILF
ncbi:alpha/beta hydrolase fold domain-containing protein [Aquimarina algicola]|uniref:Alpha/beta hydrolase n=1 Tax=Aquimarina algicola TaxID=2589995 RepID=A0A504J592_9FLAO|nr:alpha/beta hydrolase fold domain-containing protein [Aquimarina algicola]TPN85977.1 alpha/beta hydrolase [Aquimarina algicola]